MYVIRKQKNSIRYNKCILCDRENNSSNILLLPLQSEEMFPYSMACGDIGIVSQEASMAQLFMPSKTYSMMACGEAIIGIGSEHDDLKSLIENGDIGYCITDKNPNKLSELVLSLYHNSSALQDFQNNARSVAVSNYSIDVIETKYRKLFQELVL